MSSSPSPAASRYGLSIFALVAFLWVASPAFAELPGWSVESMAPKESDLKDGWVQATGDGPAGAPTAAELGALAKEVGLGDMEFYVEARRIQKGSGPVADVAWVDIDAAEPGRVRQLIDGLAAQNGWLVREVGGPHRLLVVGGAEGVREDALVASIHHAVRKYGDMALVRLRAQTRTDEQRKAAEELATGFLEAARTLGTNAGLIDAIQSAIHHGRLVGARAKMEQEEARAKQASLPAEKVEEAKTKAAEQKAIVERELAVFLPMASEAFREGRPLQATGSVAAYAAGNAGGEILVAKDAAKLDEAVRLLRIAIEHEGEARNQTTSYGNRYNLACAYARLGRLDDAFEWLEKSLEMAKLAPINFFGTNYLHLRDKDEDMDPLRADDRWAPLLKAYYSEDLQKWEERHNKAEAERKKQAAAQKEAAEKRERDKAGAAEDGAEAEEKDEDEASDAEKGDAEGDAGKSDAGQSDKEKSKDSAE